MSTAIETPIFSAPSAPTAEEPIREIVASDYEALYFSSQEKVQELENIISASRVAPVTPHPSKDARPGMTAETLRARVGDTAWLNMTKSQKISGLGVDPATVDEAFLYRVFGRGADSSVGKDLFASNPLRYRVLKECAKALQIFGASPKQ